MRLPVTLLLVSIPWFSLLAASENDSCQTALPFCGSDAYTYPAGVNTGNAQSGPFYDCLGTQPNPAWYYMQVGDPGNIIIYMFSTPALDIDFCCWGPFTTPTGACEGGLTADKVVDCSYSPNATETCTIPNAQSGEFYILLITNFSNQPCNITFEQSNYGEPGAGTTNCNIVIECSVVSLTANPTACNPSANTYDVSGSVEFSNPPATGVFTITDLTATPPVSQIFTSPFSSPIDFMLTGIPCDGLVHTLVAVFSDSTDCTLSVQYTAPDPVCPTAEISGGGAMCDYPGMTVPVYISLTGASPWDFIYAIDGISQTPVTNFPGPSPYVINTAIPGIYTMVSVSNSACPGIVSGNAVVVVHPLPAVTLDSFSPTCINSPPFTLTGGSPPGGVYSGNGVTAGVFYPGLVPAGPAMITYTYTDANTCTNADSSAIPVNPNPGLTATPNATQLCSGDTLTIFLEADQPDSTFHWTANASSTAISGFSNGSGDTVIHVLANSGLTPGTVEYIITAQSLNCYSEPQVITVTVMPVPDVYFVPNGQTVCSGQVSDLSLLSHVTGTAFTWTATGSSPAVSGYSPGSGDLIQQTLFNSGYLLPWVTYLVTPMANGCTGTQNSVDVTVYPLPVVSFTVCYDTLLTTESQPFNLSGGAPPQGTFAGPGVTNGRFYPAMAGTGRHTITYSYSNTWGCNGLDSLHINVVQPPLFSCGDNLTDIRDNQVYPTVLIGPQCWMAANLNYGDIIVSSLVQRDNCIPERYCVNDNPANCLTYGGLYQWDELMRYDAGNAAQGFCPAGWHIPSESDWNTLFNFYISNGFAGSALKSSGFSGFNALMSGIRFHNSVWKFRATDPVLRSSLFWSSTQRGPGKAWAHGMNEVVVDTEYTPSVSFYPSARTNAFFGRCLKD